MFGSPSTTLIVPKDRTLKYDASTRELNRDRGGGPCYRVIGNRHGTRYGPQPAGDRVWLEAATRALIEPL